MKSNATLGFTPIFGDGDASHGYGDGRTWANADGGGSLTIHATIGLRGQQYRAYAYTYHNEQDASREGIVQTCAARGESPQAAMDSLLRKATELEWSRTGLAKIAAEISDELAEGGAA